MSAVQRLLAAAALDAQDDWAAVPAEEPAGRFTPEVALAHTVAVSDALDALDAAVDALNHGLAGTRQHLDETYPDQSGRLLIELTDRMQAAHKLLGQILSLSARECGMRAAGEGVLPDGRTYVVARGRERKAWDHGQWQAAADREVLSGVEEFTVYDQSGTAVDTRAFVAPLLRAAHDVHGAGAPKVGQLRKLGLTPDEFCESVPGKWSVRVMQPGSAPLDEDAES